jgi:enterochelin esterase-like enzyme
MHAIGHFTLGALASLTLASANAQGTGLPAETNVRGADTPRIHPDGAITFTLNAPAANTVLVAGGDGLGKGPFAMVKGSRSLWSVTTPPAAPGFHYYWFIVDGVQVNDPSSETYFGYNHETSGVEVPDAAGKFYALSDVPHGEVRSKWYFSKTTGDWRRALVYTPPGYDSDPKQRYPVLLLQHGAGENETGWTRQGRANFILDNLIAARKSVPMIVVMDCGYATRYGTPPVPIGVGAGLESLQIAFSAFEDVVMQDLLPMIDATYRTIPDRDHRAMAGLSMGGMQTLFITLHDLNRFTYIGSFSGPIVPNIHASRLELKPAFDTRTAYEGAFADPNRFNERVKVLWLGVGSEEPELFHIDIHGAANALKSSGVHVVYVESPGTAHEWQTWRRALNDFAPRLFH